MSLLDARIIDEIYSRAIALGLARERSTLLSGLDPGFVAVLETNPSPNSQLLLDLRALNHSPPDANGQLPLGEWLNNAALLRQSFPDAAWLKERAAELLRLPQTRPADTRAIADRTIATLKGLAATAPALSAALGNARREFEELTGELKLLIGYKRLHDILHNIQIYRLPFIQTALACENPLASSVQVRFIVGPIRELGERVDDARAELGYFPESSHVRADQESWVDELGEIQVALDTAVRAADAAGAIDAVGDLRRLLQNRMPRLNLELYSRARGLRIDSLVDHLRRFAEMSPDPDDVDALQLRETATRLALLQLEIKPLIDEHNAWQQFDDKLWSVEGFLLFQQESSDALRQFTRLWPAVLQGIERIARIAPGPWHDKVRRHADTFAIHCPLPAQAPILEVARDEFHDFAMSAREKFFKVDRELISRCNRLEELAGPLDDLVRTA